nr:MAG TPA: hypothetical protein [Caudoviricetes sp.]
MPRDSRFSFILLPISAILTTELLILIILI